MEQVQAEREAEKKQKLILNEIYLSEQKALADAQAYQYALRPHKVSEVALDHVISYDRT